ncbi:MAG: sigma-70 family RNA polymerase sigma factor [Eubacteriales bacterium]
MLSNQEDAYDAAQEVFVRVYKSIESFKEQSSFTTWLYRITKNVCSDILRKRQKHSGVISINQAIDEKKIWILRTKVLHRKKIWKYRNVRELYVRR